MKSRLIRREMSEEIVFIALFSSSVAFFLLNFLSGSKANERCKASLSERSVLVCRSLHAHLQRLSRLKFHVSKVRIEIFLFV